MVFTFQLTESALTMAIVGIMQVVPSIIFSGVIGVYIDKLDRKKVMIASHIVRIITAVCIPMVEVFSNYVPLLAPVDFIYVIVFIYSIANVFFYPARNASIPNVAELDELVTANSLSQLTYQLVTLMFMPIGGILVEMLAPDYYIAFMLDASTFLISAIAIASVKTSLKPKRLEKAEDSFRKQLMDGASV
ncbi:MAG: MFS transporter, partial [Candidatus Lokiarchaeota archaeon]|nr:MFS transporter [Candidatus Lokiarchaeota archaeon]